MFFPAGPQGGKSSGRTKESVLDGVELVTVTDTQHKGFERPYPEEPKQKGNDERRPEIARSFVGFDEESLLADGGGILILAAHGEDFAGFEGGKAVDVFDGRTGDEFEPAKFGIRRGVDGAALSGQINLGAILLLDDGARRDVEVELVVEF